MLRPLWIIPSVILVDQVTKGWWFEGEITTDFALNSFALVPSLSVAVMLLSVVIFLWKVKEPEWAVYLAAGGALSNTFDRLVYGGVRDFIPGLIIVWNLADLAILVGLVYCFHSYNRRGVEQ